MIRERIQKLPNEAEAPPVFNYPYEVLEEALVNAVYHRGYDQREPTEVRVNPECIQIINYPGALFGITNLGLTPRKNWIVHKVVCLLTPPALDTPTLLAGSAPTARPGAFRCGR